LFFDEFTPTTLADGCTFDIFLIPIFDLLSLKVY